MRPSIIEVVTFVKEKGHNKLDFKKRRSNGTNRENPLLNISTKSSETTKKIFDECVQEKGWEVVWNGTSNNLRLKVSDTIGFHDEKIALDETIKTQEAELDSVLRKNTRSFKNDSKRKLSKLIRANGTGLLEGLYRIERPRGHENKNTIFFSIGSLFIGEYVITFIDGYTVGNLLEDQQVEVELTPKYSSDENEIGNFFAIFENKK